jgi:hypothetical protein
MKNWYFFWAVILLSVSSTCFAQEVTAPKKAQQKAIKLTKTKVPLDSKATRQPEKFSESMLENDHINPEYQGFSAEKLISEIEKLTASTKGEFESTADYNARKSAALKTNFYGNSAIDDVFAFSISVKKVLGSSGFVLDGFSYKFNADNGEVSLYVLPRFSTSPMNGIGAPGFVYDPSNRRESTRGLDVFRLGYEILSKSTYQASNAYGATVTVEKTTSSAVGIAAQKIPFLVLERASYYRNPPVSSQFNLDNAKAAKELPRLKALIIMKLSDPYVVYNYFHSEPTRDSPSDLSVQEKYLTGDVLGIVFYSGLTGEIFTRMPSKFGQPIDAADQQP